tara:strand:+ start:410 stop:1963 length:1554 start_codon:yes stop_codon:yes gene_type:complete
MAELPRFSRNYGRSGAYENPAIVVDTKTAEIWANVIDNIGKQTQARLASKRKAEAAVVKETQDKIAYGIKQRKENAKEVYKFLGVNGLNNPALIDYATEQIDTLTKIDMASYKATDPRQANEFAKQYDAQFQSMLSMKGVLTSMKESDAMWKAGLGSESTVLGVGSPGGLSAYSEKDTQYIYGNMIRSGMGDGGTERFYKDEAGTMMVEYKGGVAGKEGFTVVAEDFFNYMPETVPDDKADLTSRLQKSNVITKDLSISPTLREKQNGEDVVTSDIDRDTQSLVTFSPLNTSQIAASSATISKALATNRLMSVAAQNSYTQNVRPFLKSRGITQEDGSDWPEELETGDGINGKSFYSDKSQGIYKQALTAYTENMFGLNKTNQVISTTKLTDSEFKRRLGIVDKDEEKTGQEKINVQVIDELKIPTISDPIRDRFAIAGVKPKINLKATNELLRNKGFETSMAVTDDEGKITVIKVESGLSGKNRVVQITQDTDADTIKDLLKQVVTGKRPPLPVKK